MRLSTGSTVDERRREPMTSQREVTTRRCVLVDDKVRRVVVHASLGRCHGKRVERRFSTARRHFACPVSVKNNRWVNSLCVDVLRLARRAQANPQTVGGEVVDRTFYIVNARNGASASDCVGTVLGQCNALHVAVAVCHKMSDDLLQHWGVKSIVIVESKVPFTEGDEIPLAAAVRVFDDDGTRH